MDEIIFEVSYNQLLDHYVSCFNDTFANQYHCSSNRMISPTVKSFLGFTQFASKLFVYFSMYENCIQEGIQKEDEDVCDQRAAPYFVSLFASSFVILGAGFAVTEYRHKKMLRKKLAESDNKNLIALHQILKKAKKNPF